VLWLYFHRYLLRNQTNLDNGILHTDPKSTTLGPQLIFISKFLEKAPFLAQNAENNYRLEFEKDENTIDNTSVAWTVAEVFRKNNVGFGRRFQHHNFLNLRANYEK